MDFGPAASIKRPADGGGGAAPARPVQTRPESWRCSARGPVRRPPSLPPAETAAPEGPGPSPGPEAARTHPRPAPAGQGSDAFRGSASPLCSQQWRRRRRAARAGAGDWTRRRRPPPLPLPRPLPRPPLPGAGSAPVRVRVWPLRPRLDAARARRTKERGAGGGAPRGPRAANWLGRVARPRWETAAAEGTPGLEAGLVGPVERGLRAAKPWGGGWGARRVEENKGRYARDGGSPEVGGGVPRLQPRRRGS